MLFILKVNTIQGNNRNNKNKTDEKRQNHSDITGINIPDFGWILELMLNGEVIR